MAIGSLACPTNSETTMIYRIDPNSSSDITVPNVRHVIFIRTNPNSPLSLMTTITLANTFTKIIEFYRDENTSNNN